MNQREFNYQHISRNLLPYMGFDAQKPVFEVLRTTKAPACASAQSGQCLCYWLIGKNHI